MKAIKGTNLLLLSIITYFNFNIFKIMLIEKGKNPESLSLQYTPRQGYKRLQMPGRHSSRAAGRGGPVCTQVPCTGLGLWKACPVSEVLSSLGMLPDFLPTVELMHPVLGAVMGYSDLVEPQLICTPHTCFPITGTMLLKSIKILPFFVSVRHPVR